MKIKKTKIMGILLTLVMLVAMLGVFALNASAAEAVTYVDRYWDENQKTVVSTTKSVSDYTVVTSDTSFYTGWCVVNSSVVFSGTVYFCDAHLILADDVTFTAPSIDFGFSGGTSSLTVYGQTNGTGKILLTPDSGSALKIPENAHLIVNGGGIGATSGVYGAGIGGDNMSTKLGKLTVNGGIITAKGGECGAGIGMGYKTLEKHLEITINDGDVIAIGGKCAPGISTGIGTTVTINGGIVKATGGERGAGIGSRATTQQADNGEDAGDIVINGGDITAKGGSFGAGIGSGGYGGDNGNTIINGGLVTAIGSGDGAGIGGGWHGNGGSITINGGTVSATASDYGAGIGGGSGGSATILITGGKITANGGESSAGIGGGYNENATITITGGSVIANGGTHGPGIGSGQFAESEGSVTISGGTITATGGKYGAGIGNTYLCEHDVDIVITGGTITAIGGEQAAGIGTGTSSQNGGKITISGGTITANGGHRAAGVGTGCDCRKGVSIVITGGSLNATKGDLAEDDVGRGQFSEANDPPSNGTSTVTLRTMALQGINRATSITSVNGLSGYGVKDVSTDADGKLYLYLPADAELPESIVIGENEYYGDGTGEYAIHQHSFTYVANGATITATCQNTDGRCTNTNGGTATVMTENATYTGSKIENATVIYNDWVGANDLEIIYTDNTNAGTATASITAGETTASVQFTIEKAEPKRNDFTSTLPTDLTYNGEAKASTTTVKDGIVGMGDFIVWYEDSLGNRVDGAPTNAGRYYVYIDVAEGDNYEARTGIERGWYDISPFTLGDENIVMTPEESTYNGSKQQPEITVLVDGKTLVLDKDYTVTWYKEDFVNADTYIVKVVGIGNYAGEITKNYTIHQKPLNDSDISINSAEETYSGGAYSPVISVKDGDIWLSTGPYGEFDVTWDKDGFVDAGTYTATITGKNNYSGSFTRTFVIKQAELELEFSSPISSVLPGNQIALTLNTNSDAAPNWSIVGGEHVSDKTIKINDSLIIGKDKVSITVTYPETINVKGGSNTITLEVGMPDFTSDIEELEADIEELNELIDQKAALADVTDKLDEINAKLSELERNGATDAELGAAKTDLTNAYEKAIKDATDKVYEAIEDLKSADKALQNAIDTNSGNIASLTSDLADKYNELTALIGTLPDGVESMKDYVDGINTALANADATMQDAINQLRDDMESADNSLQDAIDTNSGNIATLTSDLADKYNELTALIGTLPDGVESMKDYVDSINSALEDADTTLKKAIDKVSSNLATAEKELADAIKSGDASLGKRINIVSSSLNAAKKALAEADEANKAALEAKIEAAESTLDEAIKAVQKNLDDAKAELEEALANGDKANADAIAKAAADLNAAIEEAKSAAIAAAKADATEATDALEAELTSKIENADATLKSSIDALAGKLDDVKSELTEKDKALQTFITVVCVISGVAFCGSGAFVTWFFIDRKKRIK